MGRRTAMTVKHASEVPGSTAGTAILLSWFETSRVEAYLNFLPIRVGVGKEPSN